MFSFLKFNELEMFLQKQDFYIWMKGKTDLTTFNNPNGDSHEKNCSETRRSMVETRNFYIKLFMSICTRENSSRSSFHLFLLIFHSHCCEILQKRRGLVFLISFIFQHRNKIKTTFTKHREISLLDTWSLKCLN